VKTKTIALPRLDGLRPTLESTALKLLEEAGELAEAIGKFRALSGERTTVDARQVAAAIARELLDVAQTAVTMMFVLEEREGVDIEAMLQQHIEKLAQRGYLFDSPRSATLQ
jgi:NTP pyrophosphatase (non-canonical NTP hydrolase)